MSRAHARRPGDGARSSAEGGAIRPLGPPQILHEKSTPTKSTADTGPAPRNTHLQGVKRTLGGSYIAFSNLPTPLKRTANYTRLYTLIQIKSYFLRDFANATCTAAFAAALAMPRR